MASKVSAEIGGRLLSFESGRLAKFAHGAVLVQQGETVVLAAATASKSPKDQLDFFPLTVEYREKTYAAGRVPGGWFKREGRPTEKEIITSRLIDRPVRPLFPEGFRNEVQVMCTVLSADQENDADVLAVIGASAALSISGIPFDGPIGAIRVGRVKGAWVFNPTHTQLKESDLDLVVVSRNGNIVMIEAGAHEVSEEDFAAALDAAQGPLAQTVALQQELIKACGKPKTAYPLALKDPAVVAAAEAYRARLLDANYHADKARRQEEAGKVKDEAVKALAVQFPEQESMIKAALSDIEAEAVRHRVLESGERPDGRKASEVRALSGEVAVLPRTHGSALFTRGQTQALVVTTLGTKDDQQIIEELEGESIKRYMLHYNFPPFSTGETKPLRGPGRREIGHGALAEKALGPMLPPEDTFPYTIRVVSEILESNGSSSMASVCGASLSLMDAGVPITSPVAGISVGLMAEGSRWTLLTDIQGLEDHYGDMDFKVAGSRKGITAVQLDIKSTGISMEVVRGALAQARSARLQILEVMARVLPEVRAQISPYAPRFLSLKINPEKIKDVIGPGGKMIKKLTADFGVSIDVEDDGTIHVASVDPLAAEKAVSAIKAITAEPEVGKLYRGKVRKIMEFGAFVEIMPGTDGLLHISQLDHKRVKRVEDVVREGDEVLVKVLEVENGRIRLSRKDALQPAAAEAPPSS